MAKAPVAGTVKTRLCPPLTPDGAAALAAAALLDTVDAVTASAAARAVLALDGAPGPWLPGTVEVMTQRTGEFGERLSGAIADAWAGAALPVVVVGMDTPQMTGGDLNRVAEPLLSGTAAGAVLGPADDGGYWAVGVRRPVPGMFDGVPMSTGRTGAAQLDRLTALGVACAVVHRMRDVDEIGDAVAVAALAPATRFATVLRRLVDGTPVPVATERAGADPVIAGAHG